MYRLRRLRSINVPTRHQQMCRAVTVSSSHSDVNWLDADSTSTWTSTSTSSGAIVRGARARRGRTGSEMDMTEDAEGRGRRERVRGGRRRRRRRRMKEKEEDEGRRAQVCRCGLRVHCWGVHWIRGRGRAVRFCGLACWGVKWSEVKPGEMLWVIKE